MQLTTFQILRIFSKAKKKGNKVIDTLSNKKYEKIRKTIFIQSVSS